MSKSKKRKNALKKKALKKKALKQQEEFCIISQSAYQDRHFFKAASFMAAVGLSLSAVIATMPHYMSDVKTVSVDVASYGAYVRDLIDVNQHYSNEVAANLPIPELKFAETAEPGSEFSSFVSSINEEEAQQKIDEITEDKKEQAEAEAKAKAEAKARAEAKAKAEAKARAEAKAKEEARQKETPVSTAKTSDSGDSSGSLAPEVPVSKETEKAPGENVQEEKPASTAVPASSVRSVSEKTPPSWLTLDENGIPTSYRYVIRGKSTAYYGDPITATGTRPIPGSVAVDPKEIPYGTKMYIMSADGSRVYGYAVAEDTGGFANWEHGATVDLFMNTYRECVNWGWRDAVIYIL